MYTVLLVDDHVLFREGLHSLIERWDDFTVIGEAASGEEAIVKVHESLPDLILMDVSMPGIGGLEATNRILQDILTTRVVMVTVSENEEDLFTALKGGAQGYILKNTPSRRLHSLLQGVMQGEAPISGVMAAKMLNEFSGQQPQEVQPNAEIRQLTEREIEILQLVAAGLSNPEIGSRLCISENTIKKYLRNILAKLHLNNRVQAAVYAVQEGLLNDNFGSGARDKTVLPPSRSVINSTPLESAEG